MFLETDDVLYRKCGTGMSQKKTKLGGNKLPVPDPKKDPFPLCRMISETIA